LQIGSHSIVERSEIRHQRIIGVYSRSFAVKEYFRVPPWQENRDRRREFL